MPCDACHGLLYLHIDYDGTEKLEIERCDMCCYPELDDDDAALLHRIYCGCEVPEISEGRRGTEGEVKSAGTMMSFATFDQYPITMAKLAKHGLRVEHEHAEEEKISTRRYLGEACSSVL